MAEVSIPGLKEAWTVDLAEQKIGDCAITDGKVRLSMGHDQTVSLRLITK